MRIRLVRVTVGVLIIGWLTFAEGALQNDAAPADSYALAGIERPVEILVDPWGIAHIYAATLDDLFFAQGFNAARDRLWQIDLWRRRGLGLLSEVFGPAWVDKDRAARLLLYRGSMEAEWNAYAPDSRRIATAFARGINAYIETIRRKPALLPVEFTLLGYEPAMWSPEDIVRIRTHGLWRNLRNEVRRAESICRSGLELEQVRSVLEPPWQVKVPEFGSIASMRAVDGRQFLSALRSWGGPSLNHVFADTSGHIGWKPWGRTPVRPNWDGLVPVSGDGRYEWDGFYTVDKLPEEFDPQRGWLASANQMNLPQDYPYRERKIGFEWSAPWRYLRIAEVLIATNKMTVGGSLRLQTDYLSIPARRIVALLEGVRSPDVEVTRAIELLRSWDFVLAPESAQAVIFEVWMRRHLGEAVRRKLMGPQAGGGGPLDARGLLRVLENPDARLGPDPALERRQLLLSSLRAAIDDLKKQLGPDVQKWSWGQLHHTFLEHPLAAGSGDARRALIPPGRRLPRGGSGDTVGATSYRISDYRQASGASWRMILDVGDWDRSVAMNTPGQSGDPSSPHYNDLLVRWARDQAFPLLYSRKLIEAVAERRILLSPVAGRQIGVRLQRSSRNRDRGRDRAR